MTFRSAPTVFVIDDDVEVRASIQGLLKSAGLHSESFGTAEEFLRNEARRTGRVVLSWTCPFLESGVSSFRDNWRTPAFLFPSSLLLALRRKLLIHSSHLDRGA
jgi:hypothetical protein